VIEMGLARIEELEAQIADARQVVENARAESELLTSKLKAYTLTDEVRGALEELLTI
jgi:uncharacterized coiled-coil protein SlyX